MTKETLVPKFLGVHISMIILASIVVSGRIATRMTLTNGGLGADDYIILLTLVIAIAYVSNNITQVNYGFGQHIQDLPKTTNITQGLKIFYIGEYLYFTPVELTKISVLFLYLRLFPSRTFRYIAYGMMAFVGATLFSVLITFIFQCNPVTYTYNRNQSGTCIDQRSFYFAVAGIDIAQDVMIYLLPIWPLVKLQMPWRERFALLGVFMVGCFVILTSILRLNSLKTTTFTSDTTWYDVDTANWSVIETCTGIIGASLVHYRPLVSRFAPSWFKMGGKYKPKIPGQPCNDAWTSLDRPSRRSEARGESNHSFDQWSPGIHDVWKTFEYDIEHGIKSGGSTESMRTLNSSLQGQ